MRPDAVGSCRRAIEADNFGDGYSVLHRLPTNSNALATKHAGTQARSGTSLTGSYVVYAFNWSPFFSVLSL